MITYKIKLGQGMLELSGTFDEVSKMSALFGQLQGRKCDACGGENIFLGHNENQGNNFYHVDCVCGAKLKISQLKKGGFYIDGKLKFEVYQGSAKNNGQQSNATQPDNSNIEFQDFDQNTLGDDEVPF